jgi:hypothetical protein
MLQSFREQRKALLSMQLERQQKEVGIRSAPKRPKMHGMDAVPAELPQIGQADFDLLKKICPLLKMFDVETHKVNIFNQIKYFQLILVFTRTIGCFNNNSYTQKNGRIFVQL